MIQAIPSKFKEAASYKNWKKDVMQNKTMGGISSYMKPEMQ